VFTAEGSSEERFSVHGEYFRQYLAVTDLLIKYHRKRYVVTVCGPAKAIHSSPNGWRYVMTYIFNYNREKRLFYVVFEQFFFSEYEIIGRETLEKV